MSAAMTWTEISVIKQEQKYKFITSAIIGSVLFGVWHVIAPIRQFTEGGSLGGMLANIAMLISTSAIVGFQFAIMTKMTGSLYMAMGAHFVNNAIVNMLHMVSDTGVDELMFVRISIAQMFSVVVVLIVYTMKNPTSAHQADNVHFPFSHS